MLSKSDPVYYKKVIGDLLKEATDEGLSLNITVDSGNNNVHVLFKDEISQEAAMVTLKGDIIIK